MSKKRYKITSLFNIYKGRERISLRTKVRDTLQMKETIFSRKLNCLETSSVDFHGRDLKVIAEVLEVTVDSLFA